MGVLQPAPKSMPAAPLKAGFFGGAGTGKTVTVSKLVIDFHRHIQSKKPVAFFDSEPGFRWVKPLFDSAGIEVLLCESRAFRDLASFVREAAGSCDIGIIDSLSHPWSEIQSAYQQSKGNQKFISIRGWQQLKRVWNEEFAGPFVTSPLHMIWTSRLASIFEESDDNEDETKAKMRQMGTKPKTETEAAYEPSLLVQMIMGRTDAKTARYVPRALVVKDRNPDPATTLMWKEFENPEFGDFLPHIERLNIGGTFTPLDIDRSSATKFDDLGRDQFEQMRRRRDAALEEIKENVSVMFGTSRNDKALKARLLKNLFGTLAWDSEIVSDFRKHPLNRCAAAAERVKLLAAEMDDNPEWAAGLTAEQLGEWLAARNEANEETRNAQVPSKDE